MNLTLAEDALRLQSHESLGHACAPLLLGPHPAVAAHRPSQSWGVPRVGHTLPGGRGPEESEGN